MDKCEKNYSIYWAEDGARGLVLGIHGFGGSGKSATLSALGVALRQKGYSMITFDLPSHGDNRTAVLTSVDESVEAVQAAVSYAQSFHEPLSVFATSFGAYLTLLYMARKGNPFEKVILRAPAVYMDEVFDGLLAEKGYDKCAEEWRMGHDYLVRVNRQFAADLEANRLEKCHFPTCDLTVIQGQKDTVVDWQKNAAFFLEKFGSKVNFYYLPQADHFFGHDGEQAQIVDIVFFVFGDA